MNTSMTLKAWLARTGVNRSAFYANALGVMPKTVRLGTRQLMIPASEVEKFDAMLNGMAERAGAAKPTRGGARPGAGRKPKAQP